MLVSKFKQEGFDVRIEYFEEHGTCENHVFGTWSPADCHVGGVTVQYPNACRNGHRWWVSDNYTPAELAKDYARQGRTNPSAEAYASLQKELCHALESHGVTATITVSKAGVDLVSDSISGFWSTHISLSVEDLIADLVETYFSVDDLIEEARKWCQACLRREHMSKSDRRRC